MAPVPEKAAVPLSVLLAAPLPAVPSPRGADRTAHDVSEVMRRFEVRVPTFLGSELYSDLVARLPGELGGMTPAARLEVVLTQVAHLLTRSEDPINYDPCDYRPGMSFTEAVARREEVRWEFKLPMLADIAKDIKRADGVRMGRFRHVTHFHPYALTGALMTSRHEPGAYVLLLDLDFPFRRS